MEENKNILKDENIDENNEQKKIEVITGDGDLNISPEKKRKCFYEI